MAAANINQQTTVICSIKVKFHFYDCVHCVSKTHQLWNDIAQNCKDQFWRNFAVIFKRPPNRVCMFQFPCRFAFLSTFRLSNRTPKITRILTLCQANAATLMPFSKEGTILIKKNLYECKGYHAWHFITEFPDKG